MSVEDAYATSNWQPFSSTCTTATSEASTESESSPSSPGAESSWTEPEETSTLETDDDDDDDDETSDSQLELIQYKIRKKLLLPFRKFRLKKRKFWPHLSRKLKRNLESDHYVRRMVLEPKFTDYGSIHSADVPQLQQHITSHPLLTQITPRSVLLPQLQEEESKSSKGKNMTQGDLLYQRQPLLSSAGWNDNRATDYYIDEDNEHILQQSSTSNGHTRIEMPMPTPIREEPRFPQERCKTVIAFLVCIFSFLLTLLSLAIIHDKVPDRESYGPLPDVILDNVPVQNWALDVSEYIIIVSVNSMLVCMVFHKHRFIVFRRIFLILSLLYMYRAITMFVTVMPISNKSYYCSPKLNHTTPLVIVQRIVTLFSGFGLSVNGKHTFCGDYIYSGHTVILIFSYLFMSEYTPKKLYLLHWLYWVFALVGVTMVQLSHGHYTVDVVIAYYITTRVFWIYHTLANNTSLKQHSSNNYLGRSWWFIFFLYFERNVNYPVPRQWPDWPLPWPRRFLTKSRES